MRPKRPKYRIEQVFDREARDWYVEPAWCDDALFDRYEFLGGAIVDPCAGIGTIAESAMRFGHTAYRFDIAPQAEGIIERDFLSFKWPSKFPNVVMNPPYAQAEAFVRHAIANTIYAVAALVQQKFLWSQSRHELFTELPPSLVLILSRRPSMLPGRLILEGQKPGGGKVDYCWVIWNAAQLRSSRQQATQIEWIMPKVDE